MTDETMGGVKHFGPDETDADTCPGKDNFHAGYLVNLAVEMKKAEAEDDVGGEDLLWYSYGMRDCMKALHIALGHPENLPLTA